MIEVLTESVRAGGRLLLERKDEALSVEVKEHRSSVVTQVDLAAERLLIDRIRQHYPDHNILSEEMGWDDRGSEFTWILDPLDGTSNFAAGLPWFGVIGAIARGETVVAGAIYLPVTDTLYRAERGGGAWRDETRVRVTEETELGKVLCVFGRDAGSAADDAALGSRIYEQLVEQSRNLRTTNCCLDYLYLVDGRFGAFVNLDEKVWDFAAPLLLLEEAGGVMTDFDGRPVRLGLGPDAHARDYRLAAGAPALHAELLALIRACNAG